MQASCIRNSSLNDSLATLGFTKLCHFLQIKLEKQTKDSVMSACLILEEAKNGDNLVQRMYNSIVYEMLPGVS